MDPATRLFDSHQGDHPALPTEYESLLEGRLIIVTGVARSGTSILGKLLGSLEPAYYAFEPALLRILPPILAAPDLLQARREALLGMLFEGVFLPALQGRNLNFNTADESYVGDYRTLQDIGDSWEELQGRQAAIEYIREEDPTFIVKIPNIQPLLSVLEDSFENPSFLHIIRDGEDVIQSSVERGLYTDSYLRTHVNWMVGTEDSRPVPWYLDDKDRRRFSGWGPRTRAACIWRSLVQAGRDFSDNVSDRAIEITYEDFVSSPAEIVDLIEGRRGLQRTQITERHLESIHGHVETDHPPAADDLESPEKRKFLSLMKSLGYESRG